MKVLPTLYQQVIHQTRYARYIPELQRRETWPETVGRYVSFFRDYLDQRGTPIAEEDLENVHNAILNLDVMPSMRALMTAGPALTRENIAGFNCSYVVFDNLRAFDETLYILMCGTGVGFSVERQYVTKLPDVPSFDVPQGFTGPTVTVGDSKEGWAKAIRETFEHLFNGVIPVLDTSKVRPAGERLKTFGGRASGPEPLQDLFQFIVHKVTSASGRKLESVEVHDIACKIGEIVVVGGVRRSALISLSNLSDGRMRDAKNGQFWNTHPERGLANNSVAYTEKPEVGHWLDEWSSLYHSQSGERGIFNREAAKKQVRRFGRDDSHEFGTNPCGEIILRPNQFCNLSEVVARHEDTAESLEMKVEIATIIGTLQSLLTDFGYLRDEWRENCEEERLLGVSLTGIMDCPLLNTPGKERNELLRKLRDVATQTNKVLARTLGINASAAITCVKPSGTVSQLVDASSGIHPRFAERYVRRIRNDDKDPITKFMIENGVRSEADLMPNATTTVFEFPIEAPGDSVTREDVTAIEELETWLDFKTHWCHHNPSITVNVRENEWPEVGGWVYNNFDEISGVSFLPFNDSVYQQMPYEVLEAGAFQRLVDDTPDAIRWDELHEPEDNTTSSQEPACAGGHCEWSPTA